MFPPRFFLRKPINRYSGRPYLSVSESPVPRKHEDVDSG
jgi:hypothetical protein